MDEFKRYLITPTYKVTWDREIAESKFVLRYLEGLPEWLLRSFNKAEQGEGENLMINILPSIWKMLGLGLPGDIQVESWRQREAIGLEPQTIKAESSKE